MKEKDRLNRGADGATVDAPDAAAAKSAAEQLAKDLRQDRLDRRMAWPAYAAFLSQFGDGSRLNLSTVYKIVRGVTKRPHELTVLDLRERLDQAKQHGGAAREVVSIRQ